MRITITIAIFFDKSISCISTQITETNAYSVSNTTLHTVTYPRRERILPNFPWSLANSMIFSWFSSSVATLTNVTSMYY